MGIKKRNLKNKKIKISKPKMIKVYSLDYLKKDLVDNKIIINHLKYGVTGDETLKDFQNYNDEELKYCSIEESTDKALKWYESYAENKINDFNVYICLGDKGYTKKPNKKETEIISNNIASKSTICSLTEFKDKVGNKGFPFCCGIFINLDNSNWLRRIKSNFCWQQVWALDFDGGITFEDFRERAEKYNISPLFVYKTLSCDDERLNKFRAVWVADFACTHTTIAESIGKLLMTIFPESDKACKDASRIYFGGKGIIYKNDWGYLARLDLLKLINAVQQYVEDTNYKHRLEDMKLISENTGICLNNGLLDVKLITIPNFKSIQIDRRKIGLENSKIQWGYAMDFLSNTHKKLIDENILEDEDSIYVLIRKLDNSFNHWYVLCTNWSGKRKLKSTVTKEKGKYVVKSNYEHSFTRLRERGIKKEDIEKKCRLCSELFRDEYLSFEQLFGICTNLINIDGGLTLFKESLENSQHNIGRNTNWQEHSEIVNKQELYPTQCIKFCPYTIICKHRKEHN